VPGRIEVLGKHVDYAGGRSLLCATEVGFSFEVTPRGDGRVHLHDRISGQRTMIGLDGSADGGGRGPVWSKYPRAVVRRVLDDFFREMDPTRLSCEIGFSSDLPSAAGLSSSSAFTTGVLLCLDAVAEFLNTDAARRAIPSLADLADYVGAIESGRAYGGLGPADGAGGAGQADSSPVHRPVGVGVRGGSQDHTAILCSRPGELLQASFGPVQLERYVALPPNLVFVIGVSGVRASKAAGARGRYNSLSDLATRIAAIWRAGTDGDEPHLGAILDSSPGAADRLRRVIEQGIGPSAPDDAGAMIRRIEQFRTETRELIPAVARALDAGDLSAVGGYVAMSQRLAETHLGNQVPETMHLAASARDVGAIAASAFGAGFGGAVWALVERDATEDFTAAWRRSYREAFPNRASRARFVATDAAEPAGPVPSRFRAG
jgi:galactokinase